MLTKLLDGLESDLVTVADKSSRHIIGEDKIDRIGILVSVIDDPVIAYFKVMLNKRFEISHVSVEYTGCSFLGSDKADTSVTKAYEIICKLISTVIAVGNDGVNFKTGDIVVQKNKMLNILRKILSIHMGNFTQRDKSRDLSVGYDIRQYQIFLVLVFKVLDDTVKIFSFQSLNKAVVQCPVERAA
jgi:hypothetical protein